MIRLILLVTLLLCAGAQAQTYFGDNNPSHGTCCSWTAQSDLNGQSCDAASLAAHPTCAVITQAQWQAFQANALAPQKTSKTITASGGTPTLGTCTGGTLVAGSTDGQGAITFSGASIVTSCQVNFGSPPYSGPGCQPSATSATSPGIITTSTGFTYKLTAAFPNGQVAYSCPQ